MFFAGGGKEKHAERDGDDATAEEASHNALPQLSVSAVARKDESAQVRRDRRGAPNRSITSMSKRIGERLYNEIERRRLEVTIRRGGPHGQKQRLERSLRSRFAFRRHAAVFCADFLHAKRYTVVDLV